MTSQLGAQFSFSIVPTKLGMTISQPGGESVLTGSKALVTPPGTLRIGQSLYVEVEVDNTPCSIARQVWLMPWWLHPTFEFRYPGQNGYTAQDTLLFGPEFPAITLQDSLWMTSPKRLDIIGAPSPSGSSISDMQSDIWAIDVPALGTAKKAFFYPSHGYGLAVTGQSYNEGAINTNFWSAVVRVTPGALHSVFQDSQG